MTGAAVAALDVALLLGLVVFTVVDVVIGWVAPAVCLAACAVLQLLLLSGKAKR